MKGTLNLGSIDYSSEGIIKLSFVKPVALSGTISSQASDYIKNIFISEFNQYVINNLGFDRSKDFQKSSITNYWISDFICDIKVIEKFLLEGCKLFDIEVSHVCTNGLRYYSSNLIGVLEDDKLHHIWCTMRDVTDLKNSVETLLKVNESYIEKSQQLDFFNQELSRILYKISHDLHSPLSNIEGLINILKLNNCYEDAEIKPLIDLMSTAVAKFKTTVKEVAKVPSIQKLKLDNQSRIEMSKIWEKVLSPYEDIVVNEGLKVSSEFEVENTEINSSVLYSVFHGMLDYAIKHKHQGQELDLKIKTYKNDEFLIVESKHVFDESIHLPDSLEEERETDSNSTMDFFLIKKIVEREGGRLEIKTHPRKFTTIKIFLKE